MTCPRLEEVLVAAPTAEALAHAKTCPDCGPARAAWDAIGRTVPSPAALEKARSSALAELKLQPVARAWWTDALLLVAVNLGVATAALSLFQWHSTQHDSPLTRWGVGAGLVGLIALGAWAAIQPGLAMIRIGTICFAALIVTWAGLGGSGVGPQMPLIAGRGCAGLELGLSVVPLLVALWVTSRFAFDLTRTLVGGASVGATGMLVLHLHCPNGTAAHLLTFHVLPWLVLVLLTVVVRRMIPSRSFAP